MHENAQENVNSANNNGRKLVKHMIFNSILILMPTSHCSQCPVSIQEEKKS